MNIIIINVKYYFICLFIHFVLMFYSILYFFTSDICLFRTKQYKKTNF